jgi:hypothetical protein
MDIIEVDKSRPQARTADGGNTPCNFNPGLQQLGYKAETECEVELTT